MKTSHKHNEISKTTETRHNTTKLAQHDGTKPQHNKISTTQQKQWNYQNTMKTSRNTLAQYNKISPMHCVVAISLCCVDFVVL